MRLGPSIPILVGGCYTEAGFPGMFRHGRAVSWQPDPKPSPPEIPALVQHWRGGGMATAQDCFHCSAYFLRGSILSDPELWLYLAYRGTSFCFCLPEGPRTPLGCSFSFLFIACVGYYTSSHLPCALAVLEALPILRQTITLH